ncbi:Com family DNA-binding transcriptional regulator [Xanthomonas arboricola]|uniref:Com family DNA-binding transcriptional regulator n=1 Tax=Xanthomonas arboricola TaxID=56448 RepID=UPI0036D9E7B0
MCGDARILAPAHGACQRENPQRCSNSLEAAHFIAVAVPKRLVSAAILKAVLADIGVCRRELRHHSTQQLFSFSSASLTELRHEQRRNLVPPQDHAMLKNLRCGECARLLCKAGAFDEIQIKCPRCVIMLRRPLVRACHRCR